MRKFIILTAFLLTLPGTTQALDVTVIDGASRVTTTINQLQAAVADMQSTVAINTEILADSQTRLTRFQTCAESSMLYDEASINAGNPNGCVGPPPDPAALAQTLSCADGEVIKQVAGALQCVDPLEGCRIVSRQEHLVTRFVPKAMSNATCVPGQISSWAEAPVQKTLATYNSTTKQWNYTGTMQKDYVAQTGSHWVGKSNLAKAIVATCGQSGLFNTIPAQHTTYRDEHTFHNSSTQLICN